MYAVAVGATGPLKHSVDEERAEEKGLLLGRRRRREERKETDAWESKGVFGVKTKRGGSWEPIDLRYVAQRLDEQRVVVVRENAKVLRSGERIG